MSELRRDFAVDPGEGGTFLLAFSSYGMHGAPPAADGFEWRFLTREFACPRAFAIDAFQHWYLGPLLNVSSGLEQSVEVIRAAVAASGATRLVTVGSSMGGFAALLFGGLLDADLAIAFAPQTSMHPGWLVEIGDRRWETKAAEMAAIDYPHLDLLPLAQSGRWAKESWLYVDSDQPLDVAHVERVAQTAGASLRPVAGGGHEIAYALAKSGEASRILAEAL